MATTKVTTPVSNFNKAGIEEGLKIPGGDNSNQPTAVTGMIRSDSSYSSLGSSSVISHYNGTEWRYFENVSPYSQDFNTVLYNGSASNQSITGVGFQPDLVWIKCRDVTNNHILADSVRGGDGTRQYFLLTNGTNAQITTSNQIETIDSDGFTVFGDRSASNRANQEYVAWCFKAGGTAVSNTDGTITSQVSANSDLGFSIVSYTGNLTNTTTANSTSVGHGLTQAPELIIFKNLSISTPWQVFSSELTNWSTRLALNDTSSADDLYSSYPIANPTTSVFYTNYLTGQNVSGYNYIAYCFSSKQGVSKVGGYTGTGVAGNKVVTGFEPAFVLVKASSSSGSWVMLDNKRNPSDPRAKILQSDLSDAEIDLKSLYGLDCMFFHTDGFSLEDSNATRNANGVNYIYLAFAQI